MHFQDHFSRHARDYAAARPSYPPSLYLWLSSRCSHHGLAWDAGCGNGQASVALAQHVRRVHATDPSAEQIASAPGHPRITWRVEPAESCSLTDHCVDLVTAAQAFHWFNPERFCAEAERVLRPGGLVAVWCYGLSRVHPAVDAVFDTLYETRLGAFWPPERRHVENGYRELPFAFEEIVDAPGFAMQQAWTLEAYLAYLRTWSASQRCWRETGRDAVSELADAFARAWGDPTQVRTVRWPLSLRAGRTPVN
jgi:SAM-dependent methyltransferase